jgi:hypothetical protein
LRAITHLLVLQVPDDFHQDLPALHSPQHSEIFGLLDFCINACSIMSKISR